MLILGAWEGVPNLALFVCLEAGFVPAVSVFGAGFVPALGWSSSVTSYCSGLGVPTVYRSTRRTVPTCTDVTHRAREAQASE